MRVLVTGGGGALGTGVGRAFADAGWDVVATVFDAIDLGRYGGAGRAMVVDLRDRRALAEASAAIGPVDALVCCAGGFSMQALTAATPDAYDTLMDLNVRTAANALGAVALADGAGVVLVGARTWRGAAGVALYAASKAAVVSLGKSAALEWRGRARVNVVLPDVIDTPANRKAMPDADPAKWATPAEIGAVVRWLCSPEAALVTGQAIDLGR